MIISKRKQHAIISFLNGALIEEPQGRFIQPGIDRSVRYLGYTSLAEVSADRLYIQSLIARAVDARRRGLRVEPLPDEIEYVEELQVRLDADDGLRAASRRSAQAGGGGTTSTSHSPGSPAPARHESSGARNGSSRARGSGTVCAGTPGDRRAAMDRTSAFSCWMQMPSTCSRPPS